MKLLFDPLSRRLVSRVGNVSTDAIHELLAASVDVLEAFASPEQEALLFSKIGRV